jgi:threonine/homoserine/homoserine lactone efflux protein
MILLIKNSVAYRRTHALQTAYGAAFGILIHFLYCIWGLGILIQKNIFVYEILKTAGALYLIYLGIKEVLDTYKKNTFTEEVTPKHNLFMEGFLCNLLNPKAALFYIALLSQFESLFTTTSDKLIIFAILFIHALIIDCLVVFLLQINSIKSFYSRFQKIISWIFGLSLIGIAIKVLITK